MGCLWNLGLGLLLQLASKECCDHMATSSDLHRHLQKTKQPVGCWDLH